MVYGANFIQCGFTGYCENWILSLPTFIYELLQLLSFLQFHSTPVNIISHVFQIFQNKHTNNNKSAYITLYHTAIVYLHMLLLSMLVLIVGMNMKKWQTNFMHLKTQTPLNMLSMRNAD